MSPAEITAEAARAVEAGAHALHVHPKDDDGAKGVAQALFELGVGVEAVLWHREAVTSCIREDRRTCLQVSPPFWWAGCTPGVEARLLEGSPYSS